MPYWGANVRSDKYVVQAKLHGSGLKDLIPASNELIEYIKHLTHYKNIAENSLAPFFAEKIAAAFIDHPEAMWVTVDVLTTEGRTFGETRLIKE
jgi:hypothetical protein